MRAIAGMARSYGKAPLRPPQKSLTNYPYPPATTLAASPPEGSIDQDEENFLSHLLAESGDGDLRAFATLYRCTAPRLYPLALRLRPRQDEADVLFVDTYLHIWTGGDRYHPSRSAALDWMIALLYQLAERPPPQPSDEPWPELPPPDELWPAIRARLPDDEDDSRSLRRPLIIACVVGVLIGVLLSLTLLLHLDRPLYRGELFSRDQTPVLQVEVHPDYLNLHRLDTEPLPADGHLQLWVLPDDAAPVLLGTLPKGGNGRIELAGVQRGQLQDGAALQITPSSPNGGADSQPAGPVLYRGNLHPLP